MQGTKMHERRLELLSDGDNQSIKKARQNGRSERRRLQAQLRERARLELEYVRAAREQLHNADIFPYKACERGTSPNSSSSCSKPRQFPLAGSTDVSKVRRIITASGSVLGGYNELAEYSGAHATPETTTNQREEAVLDFASPVTPDQEVNPLAAREMAIAQQVYPASVSSEERDFDKETAQYITEQEVSALAPDRELSTSAVLLPEVREAEVAKAETMASVPSEKSIAVVIEQLLAFRIVSESAAAAVEIPEANVVAGLESSSDTAACGDREQERARKLLTSFAGAPSATAVAKKLSQNISRYHPMYHTVRSILKSDPLADSSSSSSSDEDDTSVPAYRTLSVQRRSCMRRTEPLPLLRMNTSHVEWAPNADEAIYIEYVAPVVSLLPPETVEIRPPSLDEPPKQVNLASKEAAAARAAAAAKAAAEGDPEREAAAEAAAATAAVLAKEAAEEAAEVAEAEAKATAEEEAKAAARLAAVAAVLAKAEARTLAAKARAGRLTKEEFEQWQGRLEER
ncbi:hypothetical protein, conserved [Eimeria praecox]|uniref:Uncharacterized protein n=1 Tax=Eimeria praecox TaxID=51316 RepID=U6H506_9EIME|nr:hypothetical protein, conserved [Eimeria praecox]